MIKNILIVVLTIILGIVSVAAGVYYGQTSQYATPDTIFKEAKNAARDKCVASALTPKAACANLYISDVTDIDIGNGTTGSVYVFKSNGFPEERHIDVMIDYSGSIYRADVF